MNIQTQSVNELRKYAIIRDSVVVNITQCRTYNMICNLANTFYNKDGQGSMECIDITELELRIGIGYCYIDQKWYYSDGITPVENEIVE